MKKYKKITLVIICCVIVFCIITLIGKKIANDNPYYIYGDYECKSSIRNNEYTIHTRTNNVKIKELSFDIIKQEEAIYVYKSNKNMMYYIFDSKNNEFTFLSNDGKSLLDTGKCIKK